MSSDPSPARAIGRPREARADRAIIAATLQLMAERGVRDLRMDDVADRAGVGKATIYRRYRSKDSLVSEAIATLVREITIPDTGSTRADLLALMRQAVELYSGSLAARLMPAILEETRRNPELASTVRDEFLAGRRAALSVVLERGVRRGDLRRDLDLELALDVLGGAIFYRLLVTGGPIDERLAEGVVELILAGFSPTPNGGTHAAATQQDRRTTPATRPLTRIPQTSEHTP
jgi:AcrR family transcriptional regulator